MSKAAKQRMSPAKKANGPLPTDELRKLDAYCIGYDSVRDESHTGYSKLRKRRQP